MDSYALTTKERIKDRLQLETTNFDDLLDRLILATTDRIERMCNRRFMLATYTHEIYDGSDPWGSNRISLLLKNAPVAVVSSVECKSGSNSEPDWSAVDEDDYDLDPALGVLYFDSGVPRGRRNIRVTYTGGYSGFSIGVNNYWHYDETPEGAVDGSNKTFTLPAASSQIVVYADGLRIKAADFAFTEGDDSFTFADGKQPFSTISVDYLPTAEDPANDDVVALPLDLVEVCEEVVIRLFNRRDSEGRSSETFQESSITWTAGVFTAENLATIKNYRRASFV